MSQKYSSGVGGDENRAEMKVNVGLAIIRYPERLLHINANVSVDQLVMEIRNCLLMH